MTKFSATLIALLCFFTLCTAQTSTENDDSTTQFIPALRLPSETHTDTSTAVEITSVPLTETAFHLVNHRFPARSKKPCHHPHVKVLPSTRENEMIPYGNDMLVASGENSDFQNPVIHGEESLVPRRWVRMHHHRHHHHDQDSDSDSDDEEDRTDQDKNKKEKTVFKRYHFDRYGGEDQELKALKMMKHSGKKRGCFFKRLRKFLDHYF